MKDTTEELSAFEEVVSDIVEEIIPEEEEKKDEEEDLIIEKIEKEYEPPKLRFRNPDASYYCPSLSSEPITNDNLCMVAYQHLLDTGICTESDFM